MTVSDRGESVVTAQFPAQLPAQSDLYRYRLGIWESEGGQLDAGPQADTAESRQPAK